MSTGWILLRGLMREQRHWEEFPARFQRYFPHDQVFLADLPGFGSEYHRQSPSRIQDITDWLRQRWQAERAQGPLNLLALSLGGMVAVDWTSRYPTELNAVVLMNSSLAGISPFYQRLKPQVYWRLLKWCFWQRDPLLQEAAILQLTSRFWAYDVAILTRWAAYARELPPRRRNTLCQLLAALRYRPAPTRPSVPMLLLNGLGDELVSPSCSQAIAEHWQLPLRRHPQAGHDLPLDAPVWVCEQIQAWVEQGLEQ
ncbi:alpha/beta fold hydrolase [Zobellella maritima]|uniref:alpha/beta fold hydrolase n=1 Tax=Zobellella maritima TaxID=2059725 RepID=UPI000E3038B4|nr:alpha/beta hydrolase [Zobellella maritima]